MLVCIAYLCYLCSNVHNVKKRKNGPTITSGRRSIVFLMDNLANRAFDLKYFPNMHQLLFITVYCNLYVHYEYIFRRIILAEDWVIP